MKKKQKKREAYWSFLFKVMKVQVMLFLIGLLNSGLFAKPAPSQMTLSLNLKKASLKTLFMIIEGNTDYVILYKDDIPVHKTISIQAKTRCVGKDFRIVGVKIPSRR